MNQRLFCAALMVMSCFCGDVCAEGDNKNPWTNFIEDKGVVLEAGYTVDYFANTSGGIKRDQTYVSLMDIALELDTQKASLWPGGKLFVYFAATSAGDKLTDEIVGDFQGVSNVAAPRTARLVELWYEQIFFSEALSLLMGIHDLNTEFDVSDGGGLYINSSFGMGPEMSGGRPSTFPLASSGARLKFSPDEQWRFMVGVYDGDPGDPDMDEHFSRSDFDRHGGALLISEAGYRFGGADPSDVLPGSIKVGLWRNTGDFADVTEGEDLDSSGDIDADELYTRDGNTGGYVLIDQRLYREDGQQGLDAFLQTGRSLEDVNTVDVYVGGGLNYTGLIPSRDEDVLGVAVAYAAISDKLVDAGGSNDAETVVEMTYRVKINEHVFFQPDVQFIRHPGANPDLGDAMVVGARGEIRF